MVEHARCRCGARAAKKCSSCGCEVHDDACRGHPSSEVEFVRCLHCQKPLCFWHYTLEPTPATNAEGRAVVRLLQRCFPTCLNPFKLAQEWRPKP